jgi:DNA modification methylase
MRADLGRSAKGLRVMNRLYYGDNLEVLPEIPAGSVDLVYLDPQFNSGRSYNVIFARDACSGHDAAAQIQAFDDTWHWTPVTDQQYQQYVGGEWRAHVSEVLTAFRIMLGNNDALAYLVNMASRLVGVHGVLQPTGSLYLHCDPTMSHYVKVMLDAIFGTEAFRNEVIWKRTGAHNSARRSVRSMTSSSSMPKFPITSGTGSARLTIRPTWRRNSPSRTNARRTSR